MKPKKGSLPARRKLKRPDHEKAIKKAELTTEEESGESSVKEMRELLGRLEELEDKLVRLDTVLRTVRIESANVRDKVTRTDEEIRKFLSIFNVVSERFKPFAEFSDQGQTSPGDEELELPLVDLGGGIPEFAPYKEGESGTPAFKMVEPVEPDRCTMPRGPGMSSMVTESGASARSKHNKKPLLSSIPHDFLTLVTVMRWIEFLFERVTRDKISLVLDYYVDIGWISEDAKSEIMSYARGEIQDVTKYLPSEEVGEDLFQGLPAPTAAPYKKVEDWRLSADDHLKSLMFIQKIAGLEVDKDRLNSLELNISKFKESLEGFHGV
jgi:flagellar protein FlaD